MAELPAARRRLFRAALAAFVVAALGVAAWIGRRVIVEWRDRRALDAPIDEAGELPYRGQRQYVLDAVVGFRPRRNLDVPMQMGPLGGAKQRVRRHHDDLGLIRLDDVRELPGPPRALLVGDSHLMGVVSNADNASDLVERRLRARPGGERTAVLNGSCGFYSLYQEVLRARTLRDALRPDLFVIAVFLGNDFLELEDVGRPYLDDDGTERPADPAPPPETTSARLDRLGLRGDESLFWQGLNQACYVAERPERLEPIVAKTRRCVELADELARGANARLLFALVPSYDLVFPERTLSRGGRVAEVVRANGNGLLHDRFVELLAARGVPFVDLLPAFRQDGRDALYAQDYHLFVEGHRLLAESLLEPVAAALRSR